MSELVKCATCKTEKPLSEMKTCMHAEREHSVCDMPCMIKFYKGEIKPDTVVTPDLEEMVKLGMNPKEYHLHKENLELTEQLAKANERVGKLEKERSNLSAKYKKNVSVIGAFVSELTGKVIILPKMRTKEEIEKSFNKFAIENQVKGVNWFSEKYCDDEHSFLADKAVEQLRKEQEHG